MLPEVNTLRRPRRRKRTATETKSRRMAVGFVCQWFAPEPVNVPVWIAHSLAKYGFELTVLTGIPNYPEGRVHSGYSAHRFGTERIDGLLVRRAPLYPSHDRSVLRRSANYLSWALSASVGAINTLRRQDVVLVYSSPATAALPAMLLRAVWNVPYVLHIQDLWPDSVMSAGFMRMGFTRQVAWYVLERFTSSSYRHAEHVIVISPRMKHLLVSRGVPAEKVSLVYNWVDESIYRPPLGPSTLRRDLGLEQKFVLMYAGSMGPAQSLEVLIRAVGQLSEEEQVALVLVGGGVERERLQDLTHEVAPGRVHFVPPVSASEMPQTMAAADIQVVSLKDDPLFYATMPSKIQSIFACAQPVIAAVRGDAADAIREAGAGWCSVPGDVDGLVDCIRAAKSADGQTLRTLGNQGRAYYESTMSEAANRTRLSAVLHTSARGSQN